MPNKTTKLKLNTFLENDVVDFSLINENVNSLENMNLCVYGGLKTANYTGGSDTVGSWRCKQYADGTVDMSVALPFSALPCNNGASAPYYSNDVQVYLPISLDVIYDVQMHMASSNIGYVADITSTGVLDHLTIRAVSHTSESTNVHKTIYINVKGGVDVFDIDTIRLG